ncbi:MAG: extracellular solute-binding protein [Actinobacteria bacterium]|nr:extracellular solute-binding protein [Actinomycetota bacterium]
MRSTRRLAATAAVAAAVLTAAACGSSGGNSSSGTGNGGKASGPVTLTWWHNGNTQPLRGVWQQVANSFHAANPKVSLSINPIQSNDFATKMPVALKSNNPPDIFQQWGGGNESTQVPSGKLANLGPYDSSWIGELGQAAKNWQVNGVQYGVPYDLHVVGFWYRKDLFKKAGITSPPTTVTALESDDAKLKAKGITPISVGSKDKWPDAFYWDYFALRECPQATVEQAMKTINLSDPCFTKAGNALTAFMKTHPFQPAFLSTPSQTGAGSSAGMLANGKAAMELQGDWETSVVPALTSDKKIISKLGWFPFPSVPGGAGNQAAVLDGGDGFSCTTGAAEPACADFLKYIDSTAVQEKLVKQANVGLPANPAAQAVLSNPALKTAAAALKNAPFAQVYFDIALPTTNGQALDTATANFFAGKASAASVGNSVKASSGH